MKYQTKKHEPLIKSYNDYQKQNEEQKENPSEYYRFRAFNVLIDIRVNQRGLYYVYTQNFFMKNPGPTDKPIERNLKKKDELQIYERIGYYTSLAKAQVTFYRAIIEYCDRIKRHTEEKVKELFNEEPRSTLNLRRQKNELF